MFVERTNKQRNKIKWIQNTAEVQDERGKPSIQVRWREESVVVWVVCQKLWTHKKLFLDMRKWKSHLEPEETYFSPGPEMLREKMQNNFFKQLNWGITTFKKLSILRCTIWYILTHVWAHETITVMKIMRMSITLKTFLMLLYSHSF